MTRDRCYEKKKRLAYEKEFAIFTRNTCLLFAASCNLLSVEKDIFMAIDYKANKNRLQSN
jgi:hypothetical protein